MKKLNIASNPNRNILQTIINLTAQKLMRNNTITQQRRGIKNKNKKLKKLQLYQTQFMMKNPIKIDLLI